MLDRRAAENAGDEFALLRAWDRQRRPVHVRQAGKDPRMVGAHDADTHHADPQRLSALSFTARTMSDATPRNLTRYVP